MIMTLSCWSGLWLVLVVSVVGIHAQQSETEGGSQSTTPNIHAVIASSSRYWFNYRHANNALAIVDLLTKNGVPSDQITLMLADEYPINARNSFKNGMYAHGVHAGPTLYNATNTFIDYRGADVTVQSFLDVMLGVEESAPDISRNTKSCDRPGVLRSDADSHVIVYITGHGGDQFFKFQDEEELTSLDIARVFDQLHARGRYKRVLFMADTCQAFTLADHITAPNVLALGSSLRDQNAYAHHSDPDVGLSVMERYTYGFTEHYNRYGTDSSTLQDILLTPFGWTPDPTKRQGTRLGAHIGLQQDQSDKTVDEILFSDFFGRKGGDTVSTKSRKKSSTGTSEWTSITQSGSVVISD